MRIARQAARRLQLAAEVLQVVFAQPAFEKGPRIHAGRGVPLEIDQVAAVAVVAAAAEEVVEADFVQRGRRGERRDVPAQAVEVLVGPVDHRHRVPANDALDPPLQLAVARISRLLAAVDRVDVGRVEGVRQLDARLPGLAVEHGQELLDPLRPLGVQHILQRIEPLLRLGRIDVLRRHGRDVRSLAVGRGGCSRLIDHRIGINLRHRTLPNPPSKFG